MAQRSQREIDLDAIYRAMHKDYKGRIGDKRTVLILRDGGTTLVVLDSLTDAEIAAHLPKLRA
jgi:hypothetical protein